MLKRSIVLWLLLTIVLVTIAIVVTWAVTTGKLSSSAITLNTGMGGSGLSGYSTFPSYYLNEPIVFGLKNEGKVNVNLPNSAPWKVLDGSGIIYSPVAAQAITPIAAGQSKEWVWDQKDKNGKFVPSGRYRIIFSAQKIAIPVYINARQGSQGYFTFIFTGISDTLRIKLQNPQARRDAIDNYYSLSPKHIPVGPIIDKRPGKSAYDSQWSWELDPDKTEMGENAMELCDTDPSYVEKNLDQWLKEVGIFCSWIAVVGKLN